MMDMTRILIALFLPLTLLAQQTVNNFSVKTNLTVSGNKVPVRFDTISDMVSSVPDYRTTAMVSGYWTTNDNGGGLFEVVPNSGTNVIRFASSTDPTLAWERVDASAMMPASRFGAVGDGVADDTVALQQGMDWLATNNVPSIPSGLDIVTNLFGGVLVLPMKKTYLVSDPDSDGNALILREGLSIVSEGPGGENEFPGNNTSPRILAAPGFTGIILYAGVYVLDGVSKQSRFSTLRGFIIDGNYDLQDPEAYGQRGLFFGGSNAKNFILDNFSVYNTVGYGVFCDPYGLGASTVREYYGTWYGDGSDVRWTHCIFSGRMRGSQTGSPFPALWLPRTTQMCQVSDSLGFTGPSRDTGLVNSQLTWAVASYDDVADTITLSSTNGLFYGAPIIWNTFGTLPTGIEPTQDYHLLFTGSATMQICSSTVWPTTKAPADFTGGTLSGDSWTMGTTNAAMWLLSGVAQTGRNQLTNIRLDDSDGDLLEFLGARRNTLVNLHCNYVHHTNSVYLRFTRGAANNAVVGGRLAWDTDLQPTAIQPDVMVHYADVTKGNILSDIELSGFGVVPIIDENRSSPANQVFNRRATETQTWSGVSAVNLGFIDLNSSITNFMSYDGGVFYWGKTAPVTSSDDVFRSSVVGATQRITGDGQTPRQEIFAYGGGAPGLTLNKATGSRTSPSNPFTGTDLGAIFVGGYSDSGFTSARASMIFEAPSSWTTTSHPTQLTWELTPTSSTNRIQIASLNTTGLRIDTSGATTVPQSELDLNSSAPVIRMNASNLNSGARIRVTGDTGSTLRIQSTNTSVATFYNSGNMDLLGSTLLLGTIPVMRGSGSPEGVVTSPIGGLYLNTSGGASTTLYIKESGTNNTGWVAK